MTLSRYPTAVIALAGLFAIWLTGPAWAAGFMYFKDSPIVGEATAPGKGGGWIEILSSSPATPPAGGGTLRFTKRIDKASPKIAEARSSGTMFPTVELSIPSRGSSAYLEYKLKRVFVTSYSTSGSSEAAIETITISYEGLER